MGRSFRIPAFAKGIKAKMSMVCSGYDVAYIADAFYRANILRDEHFNGELRDALDKAIYSWATIDCQADLSGLGVFSIQWSNSIEALGIDYYAPEGHPAGWKRGGIGIIGGEVQRYALGYHCTRLNQSYPRLGTTIFNFLQNMLEYSLHAVTPCGAKEKFVEWYDHYYDMGSQEENEESGGLKEEDFTSVHPAAILEYKRDGGMTARKMSRLRKIASRDTEKDPLATQEDVAATIASRLTVKVWDALKRVRKLRLDEDDKYQALRSQPVPALLIQWNPGWDDIVSRMADDIYNYAMEDGCDLLHLYGFWVPLQGHKEQDFSTIDHAIKRLEAGLKFFAAAQELLRFLHSEEPIPNPLRPKTLAQSLGLAHAPQEPGEFIYQL